jgi:hypothetical protein
MIDDTMLAKAFDYYLQAFFCETSELAFKSSCWTSICQEYIVKV